MKVVVEVSNPHSQLCCTLSFSFSTPTPWRLGSELLLCLELLSIHLVTQQGLGANVEAQETDFCRLEKSGQSPRFCPRWLPNTVMCPHVLLCPQLCESASLPSSLPPQHQTEMGVRSCLPVRGSSPQNLWFLPLLSFLLGLKSS